MTAISAMNSVNLLGVRIDDLPVEALVAFIIDLALQKEKSIVANVNIHAMNLAYELPEFRDFLNHCPVVFCDGYGVILGAQMTGNKLHYRNTPPDWMHLLCQNCINHDLSLYFLGARPDVAERAASRITSRFPSLRVVGSHHGYFDKSPCSAENQLVIEEINKKKPDILLVGFGMPVQEFWLRDNWPKINAAVALPVGSLFDYMAGAVCRPPAWMTDRGFEWLGRLFIEPSRLWQRYMIGNPLFLWRIMKEKS